MSKFQADFNSYDQRMTGASMPLAFSHYSGDGYTAATGVWKPGVSGQVTLAASVLIAANTNMAAHATLTLLKDNVILDVVSALCSAPQVKLTMTVVDANASSPSGDSYQLVLSTTAELVISGSSADTWFSGATVGRAFSADFSSGFC